MTEKKRPTQPHRLSVFLTTTLLTFFLAQPLAEAADLYVASIFEPSFSNGRIETLNTNGTGRQTLREVGGGLRGIAVDESGNGLFWTDVDSDRIERVPLDSPGASPTGVVTSGLLFPQDLDYSPSAGSLFWTDATANLIERSDLDGGNRTPLFSANSTAIAVDEVHGKIYSEDRSTAARGAIVRCNFDGTGYEVVVTDVPTATNIAIDPIHETVYWTSSAGLANSDGGVYRVGFDGQGFDEIFLIDGTYLSTGGIAVDPAEGKVYFGQEYAANRTDIYRIDLDGSNPEVVATGFGNMSDMALVPSFARTPGDFDYDTDVDVADLMLWQRGGSPNPNSPADLAEWQANFTGSPQAGVTPVPEPASALLWLLAGVACFAGRNRVARADEQPVPPVGFRKC